MIRLVVELDVESVDKTEADDLTSTALRALEAWSPLQATIETPAVTA